MARRAEINISGIVQGVGFRPFVHNLAERLGVRGFVKNTPDGVFIEAESDDIEGFIKAIQSEAPPLSRIHHIETAFAQSETGYKDFSITQSANGDGFTLVSPDMSVCPDCLEELFDPNDRRYLYPFINCTNCGPRFSITKEVPYDRPNTTMASFNMCPDCSVEYGNPGNRRFHAQPNACPVCGPRAMFFVEGKDARSNDPIADAARLIKEGRIVAVKGLGGFHIACDARNKDTVARLRERKRRSNKPFAMMAFDTDVIRHYAHASRDEAVLLESRERPVVLLKKKSGSALPEAVSPNNSYYGFMLPYTPLHYVLLDKAGRNTPLVMTSGNIAEEPIIGDNGEALRKLSGFADAFLLHDRDIFTRLDDSVVRTFPDGKGKPAPFFIRRARGYVPDPIVLSEDGPSVIGAGADLKNTFTITRGRFAIPGQHTGDMENLETLEFYKQSLDKIIKTYRAEPIAIAHDMHPGYLSARWAREQEHIRKIPVQHHHAHMCSVMAEYGLKDNVIGVIMDGTGYGADGNIWGGEILFGGALGFQRRLRLKYIPLPGGEMASKEPWRTAISYIISSCGERALGLIERLGYLDKFGSEKTGNIVRLCASSELSPLSSGAGRLFDAVSSILGLCHINTFEAEAAIALESKASENIEDIYPYEIREGVIDLSMAIGSVIEDRLKEKPDGYASAKFHNTMADVILSCVRLVSKETGAKDVALSGGTMQNAYLLKKAFRLLRENGFMPFANMKVPPNDGGVSLGQAYIAREIIKSDG